MKFPYSKILSVMHRPFGGRGAVLCFHRILPDQLLDSKKGPNIEGLCYSCFQFEQLLQWLSSNYKLVSMDDLEKHLVSKEKSFVIALTFDDGYKDNKDFALPLLMKYNCPATIYVATRFIGSDTSVWWFELWDYIEENETVSFTYKGRKYQLNSDSLEQKEECFFILKRMFLLCNLAEQNELLMVVTKTSIRKSYRNYFLTWDEIRELDCNPLITIGAHTQSHDSLAIANNLELNHELIGSKNTIEGVVGHEIKHFAYPFGNSTEANIREYIAVETVGYKTGVTLRSVVMGSNSLTAIARIPVLRSSSTNELKKVIDVFRYRINYFIYVSSFLFSNIGKQLIQRVYRPMF